MSLPATDTRLAALRRRSPGTTGRTQDEWHRFQPGWIAMSTFSVLTPALVVASSEIYKTGIYATEAALAASPSSQGAFGSEPIGDAFAVMCGNAQQAMEELAQTVGMLSRNVAAAGVGYLVTDQGIVPIAAIPGHALTA